jgi:hypothetical protein
VPVRIELPQLRTLARHALPHLFEATIIPLALFYAALWYSGVWVALFAALSWSYLAIVRRMVTGQRIPGLLVLGALGLTVRTIVAMASGSVFVYFLQPSLTTVGVAGAFLLSVPAGRPLAARLANDFIPLPVEVLKLEGVQKVFVRITLLWALVNLVNAALTIGLLVSQPVGVFVAARTIATMLVVATGIAFSTIWFKQALRHHGVAFGTAPRLPAVAA